MVQECLVGVQAPPEGEELRVFVKRLSQDGDGLSLAITTEPASVSVGPGQDNLYITVGGSPSGTGFLLTLSTQAAGYLLPVRAHPLKDPAGHFLGEIGALDADVNHLDTKGRVFLGQIGLDRCDHVLQ